MMGLGKDLVLAFLASAAGCFDLVKQILPQGMQNIPHSEVDHALKYGAKSMTSQPLKVHTALDRCTGTGRVQKLSMMNF